MFQCILRRQITPLRVAEGKMEYFLTWQPQNKFSHEVISMPYHLAPVQILHESHSIILPNTVWKVRYELTVFEKFPTLHFTLFIISATSLLLKPNSGSITMCPSTVINANTKHGSGHNRMALLHLERTIKLFLFFGTVHMMISVLPWTR